MSMYVRPRHVYLAELLYVLIYYHNTTTVSSFYINNNSTTRMSSTLNITMTLTNYNNVEYDYLS